MNFDPQAIANRVLDECESTNDLARRLGEEGYPSGTWVSTKRQTRGRGRLGRDWISMEGNLFLSVVLRLEPVSLWSWIPLLVALAVARSVQSEFGISLQIKWPNDLWLEGGKAGGILCEGVGGQPGFIVVGLGLNVALEPKHCDQKTATLNLPRENCDTIRTRVLAEIQTLQRLLEARGSGFLRELYEQRAAFPEGTAITWASGTQTGVVQGLGPAGELLVKRANDVVEPLFAEDVSIRVK